jgi:hypothetical protein
MLPSPALLGKLAVVRGITSPPELNRRLAPWDEPKGRYSAHTTEAGSVPLLLKPDNLAE